jgi:hypothetical protein
LASEHNIYGGETTYYAVYENVAPICLMCGLPAKTGDWGMLCQHDKNFFCLKCLNPRLYRHKFWIEDRIRESPDIMKKYCYHGDESVKYLVKIEIQTKKE